MSPIAICTFPCCSLKEVIGSGQFGTVMKAEWLKDKEEEKDSEEAEIEASIKKDVNEKQEEVDVAAKMLKKKSDAFSTIKFLREAAIMGQFSHPNVVKLYGVVTEGEQVRKKIGSTFGDWVLGHLSEEFFSRKCLFLNYFLEEIWTRHWQR